jgi:uncharacterized LabA/DUF88 family protein
VVAELAYAVFDRPLPVKRRALRTNVYIDGFNLYYGCLKQSQYRWVDLNKLCRTVLPRNRIHNIHYFTARVDAVPEDPHKARRQQAYLRALDTIPNLTVHYGYFQSQKKIMRLAHPPIEGPSVAEVFEFKEKGTDVNLATHLLADGFEGDYEMAVILSNDSDLAEAIRLVRERLGLRVGVISPHWTECQALAAVATFQWSIWERTGSGARLKAAWDRALRGSGFPDVLRDRQGAIRRPEGW